jgi:hypothetical protein
MQPGAVTALGIETDTYCPARDAGGPGGPFYRHVRIVLRNGVIDATTPDARGLDVGCGVRITQFTDWQ